MKKDGIVLCATGELYQQLSVRMVRQLGKIEPNIPIELFTDDLNSVQMNEVSNVPLLEIKGIKNPKRGFSDKIEAIEASTFERLLYLDVDMLAVRPFFNDIILGLRDVDLIARNDMNFNLPWENTEYSSAILQPNTGAIALNKKSDSALAFIDLWRKYCSEQPLPHDQPSFRKAWLESKVRFAGMAAEFNCMPSGTLYYPPRIFHFTSDKWKRELLTHSQRLISTLSRLDQIVSMGEFSVVFHDEFLPKMGWLRRSGAVVSFPDS